MSKSRTNQFTPRALTASAACIALAVVISFVPVYQMPQGGSVGLCRMLFVALPGYFFGPAIGVISGITYGLLDFVLKPQFYHPIQFLLDYILGFGALGLTGFFVNRKYGLFNGYVLGVFFRFFLSALSGVIFFAEYAGDQNVWIYSIGYQSAYIVPEAVLTVVLLAIPAVQDGIDRVKRMFQTA